MGQIFSNKKSRAPLVWIVRQNQEPQNLSLTSSETPDTTETTTAYHRSLTKLFLTSENNNKQQHQFRHHRQHQHQKRNSAHSDIVIKNSPKMFSEKYIKDFNDDISNNNNNNNKQNIIKKYKIKNKTNKKNYLKSNNNNNNQNRRHSFNYQNYNCNEIYNNNYNKNSNYIVKEYNLKSIHSEPCLNRYEDITLKRIEKQQIINNRKTYQYHFGYNIKNVEDFLSKCSLSSPGNIPVVLLTSCILYQTQNINKQIEIYLPLGMVVNGMFKNQNWLYVKTPHAEEGYICYMACVPLGILPNSAKSSSLANLNTLNYDLNNTNEWNSSKSECGGTNKYNLNRNNKINRRKICRENLIDLLYIKTINNKEY